MKTFKDDVLNRLSDTEISDLVRGRDALNAGLALRQKVLAAAQDVRQYLSEREDARYTLEDLKLVNEAEEARLELLHDVLRRASTWLPMGESEGSIRWEVARALKITADQAYVLKHGAKSDSNVFHGGCVEGTWFVMRNGGKRVFADERKAQRRKRPAVSCTPFRRRGVERRKP